LEKVRQVALLVVVLCDDVDVVEGPSCVDEEVHEVVVDDDRDDTAALPLLVELPAKTAEFVEPVDVVAP
jgi:hypothetical protein